MNKDNSIDVLNTVIEINNDRIEGYERASSETDQADLKALFSELMHNSQKCKTELVNEVHRLGGTPIEGTTTSGKFYRIWMDIKAALTGRDRKAILNSCEYGEDVAVDTYDKAITNHSEDLTLEQQAMLRRQHALIKSDHDKIKSLRDMLVEQD